jgi:hypothetical protein
MSVSGEPGALLWPTLISFLKPVAVSVPATSCRLPLRSAAPRPAETRAILTNGERPHSISR